MGFEPTCLSALPPQGSAYASFATSARVSYSWVVGVSGVFSSTFASVVSGASISCSGSGMAIANSFFLSAVKLAHSLNIKNEIISPSYY